MTEPEIRMNPAGDIAYRWPDRGHPRYGLWQLRGGADDGELVEDEEVADWAAMVPAAREDEIVAFLQGRRRDCLRALRACTESNADYWRWQGHAELARQLLERLGAEVPQ